MGSNKIIFNTCQDSEFFGRSGEIEEIYRHAVSPLKSSCGIYLVGGKWIGKTELLKRVYHMLFFEQSKVAPIYYRFKAGYNAEDFADDYLRDFIRQYIAFVTQKPEIVTENISINKLERLAAGAGLVYLSRLLALHREAAAHGDHAAVLRNAISAPNHAAVYCGHPVFLMLDDFDIAARTHLKQGKSGMAKEYLKALMSGSISYLITGYTKKLIEGDMPPGAIKAIELRGINEESSVGLMEEMSRKYNINYDREILAVAAKQLGGNPVYMRSVVAAAKNEARNLETLKDLADIYVKELTEGSIGFGLRSVISIKSLNALRLLHICIDSQNGISEEDLIEQTAMDSEGIREYIFDLCDLSLLETGCGLIKWIGDKVTEDYIRYLYETEVKGKSKAEAITYIARKRLKQGFYIQGVESKGKIKDELLWLLKRFNGQSAPKVLFRNQDFLYKYNGKMHEKESDIKEEDRILLPQIIGCFSNGKYGREDEGLSIISGYGFNNSRYDDENEVVWILGVRESSAINADDADDFIRQCDVMASDIKAAAVKRWMIGRDGFTGEALKRLSVEGIYTTDAIQLSALRNLIEDSGNASRLRPARGLASLKEFEMALPMSAKAELVAARAVEEIGVNIGLDNDAITQIKTAVVEACINAFEHSKVKNGKVYCRFIVADDKLSIHIRNQGKGFDAALRQETDPVVRLLGPSKRGRGIELMKQLMDEVRFEKMYGGTKLVMVKHIKKAGEAGNG